MARRKCRVCGKEKARGHYNKFYEEFICEECAESEETKPYGRHCEFCGCDTFLDRHK